MDLPDVRISALRAPADERLDALYPEQEPFVFVPAPGDPLSSVRVFAHADGHLHYVGHGLGEAGFAFELTFRLEAPSPAPAWPVRLMNEFARHAIRARRPFGPGHYLCLPRPVDPAGRVRCGALVPDPQLVAPDSAPEWLQIVGLREEELAVIREEGAFLRALAHRAPLFVTRA